jgi:putative DNA primase/helicase
MIAARRELLPVRPEGIPKELKARRQWVDWKLEERDGDVTKVPYTPCTGCKASTTDLMTWGTFEESLAGLEQFDGVGFVFCSGDPYVGTDLDNCVDPETGRIEPRALQIIEGLNSYTEFSPSGKGVHIIVKGKIPSAVKRAEIEMYEMKRFFTITGHVVKVARD